MAEVEPLTTDQLVPGKHVGFSASSACRIWLPESGLTISELRPHASGDFANHSADRPLVIEGWITTVNLPYVRVAVLTYNKDDAGGATQETRFTECVCDTREVRFYNLGEL